MYRIRLNRICATDSAVSKEPTVTSAWWLLVAFVSGGCAGILLMALMRMAGDLPTHEGNDDGIGHEPRADAFEAEGCGRGHHGRGGEGFALNMDCTKYVRDSRRGSNLGPAD